MYRNRNNENLMEELEGRQMAVATMNMPAAYKNFYRAQIAALKQEMARRWRAAAVAKNRPRRNRKVQARVKQAGSLFLAPLYKPRTATSPAGMRAASTVARHMPNMSYVNVQAAMREMLRARRKRSPNSPRRKRSPNSPSAKRR
jgi:hypothetical protein